MRSKRGQYVGDFETTTTPNDVRVWASCLVDIETAETAFIGNDIDSMFNFLKDKNSVVYFHNLKFDGEFIISYLLKNGYKYNEVGNKKPKTFEALITDAGIFYSITVYFAIENKAYKKVVFYDSMKKLPFKVSVISKAFNLVDEKLIIDYDAPRPIGHILTDEEKQYIINDCRIVAQALKIQFEQGLTKMTNASDALTGYKDILGKKSFERCFPVFPIPIDHDIRGAYKGGFTYLNPKYKDKRVKGGVTLDVNSLYPSVMYDCLLPYSFPIYFEGEYKEDANYPLYIVKLRCKFKIKEGYIPTIQLKNNRSFIETEYLTSSGGEIVTLTLTNVDLKLFLEHYDTDFLDYLCGFKFRGIQGLFKDYIDHWMQVKENNTGALRQLAKLMLNSLYGKFATNPRALKKVPFLDDNGVVRYELINTVEKAKAFKASEPALREPVYTPMGCFITAYARDKTIRSAQSVYDRFIYADTDSLHLEGVEIPEGLEIHPTKLGAWKHEGNFTDSLFVRAKTYLETIDGELKVTCAGMPDNVKELVSYDNFHSGSTFGGKLTPKRYPGGVVLESTTFTIK